jgi:hypothetical protein
MKLRRLFLLVAALQALWFAGANAQILKPIDPNKKADLDTKSSLNLDEAQFPTVSQPTRDEPGAVLPQGDVKLRDVHEKQVNLENLKMPTIEKPVLPQANFTAKNIATKVRDESNKNLSQSKEKAPITNRQIRPFTPSGEQEMKKQLKDPH